MVYFNEADLAHADHPERLEHRCRGWGIRWHHLLWGRPPQRASLDASELQDFRGLKRDALARPPPSDPPPPSARPPQSHGNRLAGGLASYDAAFAAAAPDAAAPPRPPAAGYAAATLAPLPPPSPSPPSPSLLWREEEPRGGPRLGRHPLEFEFDTPLGSVARTVKDWKELSVSGEHACTERTHPPQRCTRGDVRPRACAGGRPPAAAGWQDSQGAALEGQPEEVCGSGPRPQLRRCAPLRPQLPSPAHRRPSGPCLVSDAGAVVIAARESLDAEFRVQSLFELTNSKPTKLAL